MTNIEQFYRYMYVLEVSMNIISTGNWNTNHTIQVSELFKVSFRCKWSCYKDFDPINEKDGQEECPFIKGYLEQEQCNLVLEMIMDIFDSPPKSWNYFWKWNDLYMVRGKKTIIWWYAPLFLQDFGFEEFFANFS